MIGQDIVQIILYFTVLSALSIPLGFYMSSVYEGRQKWLNLSKLHFIK
jgi:K+-transporting ATPase A subunit